MVIKLRAKNDANGNPRRVFVRFSGTEPKVRVLVGTVDEGYEGEGAITRAGWMACEYSGIIIDVSPFEYRRFLNWA